MLNPYIQVFKLFFIISTIKFVHCWTSSCSPCQCFEQNGARALKTSDCSSSVTYTQLLKIPVLQPETESAFLVGQHLETIHEEVFFNGRSNKLKYIDLKNCKVRFIHTNAFKNLQYLSGLDLSHNSLTELDENIFKFNNELKIVVLQNNKLTVFPENIFNSLPLLKYLDLSNNNLHFLHLNQFKNNINLERLILQSNYLTEFDQKHLLDLPKLNVLYLDNNPWKCNCQTRDLQKLIIDRKIDFIYNDIYPLCSKPHYWKGKKWLEIKPKDLCSVKEKPVIDANEDEDFIVVCEIELSKQSPIEWLLNGKILNINNNKKYETSFQSNKHTLKIKDVTLNDKGIYKCWSTVPDIQFDETKLNIISGKKPTISGSPNETIFVTLGSSDYSLDCDASGNPKVATEWLFNNKILSFLESDCQRKQTIDNRLVFSKINPNCFGNYTCVAKNSRGLARKNIELLALLQNTPSVQSLVPTDENIYESSSVSLNCLVLDPVKAKVQWLYNNQIIYPNNKYSIKIEKRNNNYYNYILTIRDITFTEAGNYKCRANNLESPDYNIDVKPGTLPSIEDFENRNEIILEQGDSKDIPCKANGVPRPTIIWEKPTPDCNKDSSSTNEILHLRNVNCNGLYKCIVINPKGRVEKEFKLSVLRPTISKTDYSDHTSAEEFDDVTLECLIENTVSLKPYWEYNNNIISEKENENYRITKIPINKHSYYYNLEIKNISPLKTGDYKCHLGSDYKSVNVAVKSVNLPSIVSGPKLETFVEFGTKDFRLKCKISKDSGDIFWPPVIKNGCEINTFVEDKEEYKIAVLVIKEVNKFCDGQYTCSAENRKGVTDRATNLKVVSLEKPIVKVETNSVDNGPAENENIILECFINGVVDSEPKWLFENRLIDTSSKKYKIVKIQESETSYWYNLQISKLQTEDRGNYKCAIKDFETTIPLNVKTSSKPVIEYISNIRTIQAGMKNYRIACKIVGIPKPKSSWIVENKSNCKTKESKEEIGHIQWVYLTFLDVDSSCSGKYTCFANNSIGIERKGISISVISQEEPPKLEIDSFSTNNHIVEDENVTLKCFIKTNIHEPRWTHNGQIITTNNKYKIERNFVNETSFWYNLIISKISQSDRGSYKCHINNFENEVILDIQKSKSPTIEYISNPDTVEEGKEDFTLTCKVGGTPKPNVTWMFDSLEITKLSQNQFKCKYNIIENNEWLYLTIRKVEPHCAGKYKCVAKNFKGAEENEIDLSISRLQPPEIIPVSENIPEHSNVTLQCLVKGIVDSKPQWMLNNQFIKSDQNKYKLIMIPIDHTSYWYNLEITNLSPEDGGRYSCKVNDFESVITLNPQPSTPPVLHTPSTDLTIEEDTKKVVLQCKVSGKPLPKITWFLENKPLDMTNECGYKLNLQENENEKSLPLVITNLSPLCVGNYKCVAENLKGKSESNINLKIKTIPPPKIEVEPTSGDQIVENGEVTLKCLVNNVKYSAEWFKEDTAIIIEPNGKYSITFDPINSTAYWHNLVISNLSPNDKGKYKCKIRNTESSVQLDVTTPGKATIEYISPKNNYILEGTQNVTLACKVSGIPKPQAMWQFESETSSESSEKKCLYKISYEKNDDSEWLYLSIIDAISSCSGKYKCVAVNSAGAEQREVIVSIARQKEPEITVQPNLPDGIIREKDNIVLKCLTTNINSKTEWLFNNKPINYQNNKYHLNVQKVNQMTSWYILTIKNVTQHDKGNYVCKADNIEQSYILNIEPAKKPIVEYFTNPNLLVDENTEQIILPCKVTNLDNNLVDWTFNDKPLDESKCNSKIEIKQEKLKNYNWYNLTIYSISSGCSGNYKCQIKNQNFINNNAININVLPSKIPEIKIVRNSPEDFIREGETVNLKCLMTTIHINEAKWLHNGNIIIADNKHKITKLLINETHFWYNLDILNIALQQNGRYTCNSGRLESSQTLNIQPGFRPIIEQISNQMFVEEGTEEIKLFCKAKGSPIPKITWAHRTNTSIKLGECLLKSNFEENTNSHFSYLRITKITRSCTGKFICLARNSIGLTQDIVNITIISTNTPSIIVNSSSSDNTIREGDNVTISCLITGINNPPKWIFKISDSKNIKYQTREINSVTYQYDLQITNIKVDQMGLYKCQRDQLENLVYIAVQPGEQPSIEQFPDSDNFVINYNTKQTTLFCKISGVSSSVVSWQHDGKSIAITNPSKCSYQINSNKQWYNLTINNANEYCSGLYKCIVNNQKGKVERGINVAVITVQSPKINLIHNNSLIKENDAITLTCLVKGNFDTPVNWLFNGNIIQNKTYNYVIKKERENVESFWYNLQIDKLVLNNRGVYKCRVLQTESKDIRLNIEPISKPIVELSVPQPQLYINEGEKSFKLFCKSTGVPNPKVTLQFNNKLIDNMIECTESCHYSKSSVSDLNSGTEWVYLTITNITSSCNGRYSCSAENSKGKTEKLVDIIVIPRNQPKINIHKPITTNNDLTVTCQVTSVVPSSIFWTYQNKRIGLDRSKYVTKYFKSAENIHNLNLTVLNIQPSDTGDYSCEVKTNNKQNSKTVTLKPQIKLKPKFENPENLWENIKINDGNIIFTTKVRSFPQPTLTWTHDGKVINIDTQKYLSEISEIDYDYFWFNQTIKQFDSVSDIGEHIFTVKNHGGQDTKNFLVKVYQSSSPGSGVLEITANQKAISSLPDVE